MHPSMSWTPVRCLGIRSSRARKPATSFRRSFRRRCRRFCRLRRGRFWRRRASARISRSVAQVGSWREQAVSSSLFLLCMLAFALIKMEASLSFLYILTMWERWTKQKSGKLYWWRQERSQLYASQELGAKRIKWLEFFSISHSNIKKERSHSARFAQEGPSLPDYKSEVGRKVRLKLSQAQNMGWRLTATYRHLKG